MSSEPTCREGSPGWYLPLALAHALDRQGVEHGELTEAEVNSLYAAWSTDDECGDDPDGAADRAVESFLEGDLAT